MSEEQVRQIEVDINVAKASIQKADALDKLYANSAFKHVITDGYLGEEARRLVLLKAEPAMQEPAHQERITKGIDAIGYLNQYLRSVFAIADMAEKALADNEATRDELLANEG